MSFEYWQAHCRNGHLVGFPNYRAAEAERVELETRARAAGEDAQRRGLKSLIAKLEALADSSRPVIAMSFAVCDNILRSDKYRNYDKRVESGERTPAEEQDHADREVVGARLFPMCAEHIHYAALSPDGGGLMTYGEGAIAVRWQVSAHYLGQRASLLDENSFMFFDHHGLGARGAVVPPGYRAIWDDRAKLVVAKIAPRLTAATSEASLSDLVLHVGRNRSDDDFIEIAIYAETGLDTLDVDLVTRQRAPTNSEEGHRWELVRDICAHRGIMLIE